MSAALFLKTAADPRSLDYEVAGLRWLAAATPAGGALVVQPASSATGSCTRPGELALHRVGDAQVSEQAAYEFGQRLAYTHAAGAPRFGAPPPGWAGNGWMGRARLPLISAAAAAPQQTPANTSGEPIPATTPALVADESWGEFFATQRIWPYLQQAYRNGSVTRAEAIVIERVCERLRAKEFDAPQPQLVRTHGHSAARLHGDLWCGNVLWTRAETVRANYQEYLQGKTECQNDETLGSTKALNTVETPQHLRLKELLTEDYAPENVYGVLIDPAAQGGHSETDLATLAVFGQPFLAEIYAGYQSVSPLAAGYQERIGLHTLHILIVHAALFGGGYGSETAQVAANYC